MISLSANKIALQNVHITITALDNIRFLIKKFSDGKLGPACVQFDNVSLPKDGTVQFDRDIILDALQKQEKHLIDYLFNLGIDARE